MGTSATACVFSEFCRSLSSFRDCLPVLPEFSICPVSGVWGWDVCQLQESRHHKGFPPPFFFFFLAMPRGMRDLHSPVPQIRDGTQARCSGSVES